MTKTLSHLAKQRRFRILLVLLVLGGLLMGSLVVPIEQTAPNGTIKNFFDGLWWSVTTITSVGYGDQVPVTALGKIIGMILQIIGVLAFGLLTGMVTMALFEHRDKYYQKKLFQRLDELEAKLNRMEKQTKYMVQEQITEQKKD